MEQQATLDVHRWSLRFADEEKERAFVKSRAKQLASNAFWCSLALFACALVAVALPTEEMQEVATARIAMVIATAVLGLLGMLSTRAPLLVDAMGPYRLEYLCTVVIILTCILAVLAQPWYLAILSGFDPAAIMYDGESGATDTMLLLMLDCIITVSYAALPVRWLILWPSHAAAVLCYGVAAYVLGGPMNLDIATEQFVVFAAITLASSSGKRLVEYYERAFFERLVDEKSVQLEMQRKLEQAAQSTEDALQLEDGLSLADTPYSGEVFERMEEMGRTSSAGSRLERIAELGYTEHWLIPASTLELLPNHVVGAGSFGIVVGALYHGGTVVVKAPRQPGLGTSATSLSSIAHELRIMRRLRHPNIILFHGACVDMVNKEIMLVLEYVRGKELSAALGVPPSGLSSKNRCMLANDVGCALRYLHSQRPCIVHGDIKGSNIMVEHVDTHPVAKLIDFGLGRLMTKHARPLGGTVNWVAPEVLQNSGRLTPAPSADVFSFGRLLYLVATGKRPLSNVPRTEIVELAKSGRVHPLPWPAEATLSKEFQPLAEECLQVDPDARPDMVRVQESLQKWARQLSAPSGAPAAPVPQAAGSTDAWQTMSDMLQAARASLQPPARTPIATPMQSEAEDGPLEGAAMVFPTLEESPKKSLDLSIAIQLNKWNIAVPSGQCCAFHACIVHLRLVCDRLEAYGCRPKFFNPRGDWQCPKCKLVDMLESQVSAVECEVCGNRDYTLRGRRRGEQETSFTLERVEETEEEHWDCEAAAAAAWVVAAVPPAEPFAAAPGEEGASRSGSKTSMTL